MRVIFLSSAYFGYVHTYSFEPDMPPDNVRDVVTTPEPAHEVAESPALLARIVESLRHALQRRKERPGC
jgi:hypothetical protein